MKYTKNCKENLRFSQLEENVLYSVKDFNTIPVMSFVFCKFLDGELYGCGFSNDGVHWINSSKLLEQLFKDGYSFDNLSFNETCYSVEEYEQKFM